jgi:hypothetical protein
VNTTPAAHDRIDDPRLRFYLERRALIDEWSTLPRLETEKAAQFLLTLEEDLVGVAQGHDAWLHSAAAENSSGVGLLGLWRPQWRSNTAAQPESPEVMVALGWTPAKVRFLGASNVPYVGLIVPASTTPSVRDAIRQGLDDTAAGHPAFPGRPATLWPRWRWEPCGTPEFWNDLQAYRRQLVAAVEEAWTSFEPIIAATFGRLGDGPEPAVPGPR